MIQMEISGRQPIPLAQNNCPLWLIIHKKKIESLFPHPSEYLYNARARIQGAPPKTNPHKNYNLLEMPKKSSLFTSVNVAPGGDQPNT